MNLMLFIIFSLTVTIKVWFNDSACTYHSAIFVKPQQ